MTDFCRRAVIIALFPPPLDDDPDDPIMPIEEAKRVVEDKINSAIHADPDVRIGGEIEDALNAAVQRAIDQGARGADALAAAVVADPAVLEAINMPGAAAVILRQFVGTAITRYQEELECWS
jgi:hypothetical protein